MHTSQVQTASFRPALRIFSKPRALRQLATSTQTPRKEGDISSLFVSLSGAKEKALPPRFAHQKRRLIAGREDQVKQSWDRLLCRLRDDADRLRIRQPGDAGFALGPHVDGGSVERWEDNGYGLGQVYQHIWEGQWEEYDPWQASCRVPAVADLYNGAGACSMFRMFQGWLSMSHTGPREGTLLVNPLLSMATAYYLLRPFFEPISPPPAGDCSRMALDTYLDPANWRLEASMSSKLEGATPGYAQELRDILHPHLRLDKTMVHMPQIAPGDYVAWHCDTIHSVDKVHQGRGDSSVLYIPACPVTEANAQYVRRQREDFLNGVPPPDFPGGKGESEHLGRTTPANLTRYTNEQGLRSLGLKKWDTEEQNLKRGQRAVLQRADEIMGF